MRQEKDVSSELKESIPEFTSRFPLEMSVLRLGGVHPTEQSREFKNPYSQKVESEQFNNIGEHCIAVAYCAEVIATKVLGQNNPEVKTIVSRALVHDSTKRFEIMRKKAVTEGIIDDAYSPTAYQTIKPLLRENGVTEEIVEYMADAGRETGHNSLPDFVTVVNGQPVLNSDNNLPEMIVHLADDMTSTSIPKEGETAQTSYVTFEERMQLSDFPNRYPFLFKEGFGYDKEGKVKIVKDVKEPNPDLSHIKTYAEWQVWVAKEVSKHLTGQISENIQQENSEQYLKNLVSSSLGK